MTDTSGPPESPGAPSSEPKRASRPVAWPAAFLNPAMLRGGPAPAEPKTPVWEYGVPLLALALSLCILVLLTERETTSRHLPPALLGTWEAAGSYAGRPLMISRDSLGFGQGEGRMVYHRIRGVTVEGTGNRPHRYRIRYDAEGGWAEMTVVHDPVTQTIELGGRLGVVWRERRDGGRGGRG